MCMGLDIVKESATYKVERYKKKLERKSKDQELQQFYSCRLHSNEGEEPL